MVPRPNWRGFLSAITTLMWLGESLIDKGMKRGLRAGRFHRVDNNRA